MTQWLQVVAQNNIVSAALEQGGEALKVPLVVRLITAVPWLQGITARFIGPGVRSNACIRRNASEHARVAQLRKYQG